MRSAIRLPSLVPRESASGDAERLFTTLLALALLWSWNAPFVDGGDVGSENVANVAQRILLALFTLSVVAYLALPLATRFLTARTGRDH